MREDLLPLLLIFPALTVPGGADAGSEHVAEPHAGPAWGGHEIPPVWVGNEVLVPVINNCGLLVRSNAYWKLLLCDD